MWFRVAQNVQKSPEEVKDDSREREAYNKQGWGQRRAGKVDGVLRSSVDCSNDRKPDD